MRDFKYSYTVPLADYAMANDIHVEPDFAWWVPFTLKNQTSFIQKIKSKYYQRTHKYGIRIHKNVREAQDIGTVNGNTVWMEYVLMEIKNNRVVFETYKGKIEDIVRYQEISGHLIYDVKLADNFRRKTQFVADRYLMDSPSFITYSTVVSRDYVQILLLVAALNDLEITGADIQNALLSAQNLENHWIKAGSEFGAEQGNTFLVVRALYVFNLTSTVF